MSIFAKLFKKKKTKKAKPKKKIIKKAKKTVKKKPAKKKVQRKKAIKKEQLIGAVTHFFPKVKAAVIKIKKDGIGIGDTLHIKGHTTDFMQKVGSIQIDNAPIKRAKKGAEIGLRVKSRVRHSDLVYKL